VTDRNVVAGPVAPRELADWLLSRGRHWITTAEAAALLGIPAGHVAPSLAAYRRRGHLFSPTKGLYVAIPPEFRSWGAVPASHFIDALMGHLGHDYYVCLLSAAEVHGFAHQRPQVFQVMTPARLRDRSFGRVHLEFVASVHTADRSVQEVNTPTGTMRVSTPEVTVLDLVTFPNLSGSLFNVATVLGDMLIDAAIDTGRLADAAGGYPAATVQRTGWLIDHMSRDLEIEVDTDPLVPLASARATPTLLDSGGDRWGEHDERWNVIANEDLEAES
jgi:predicted transcriptional regulator of viral defense system